MFSASAQLPPPAHPSNTFTILLIEDNALDAKFNKMTLNRAMYHVRIAASSDDGWQMLLKGGIHAVVAHLSADGKNDAMFAFLRRLRATHATAHLPVIIITGERRPEILKDAIAAGANSYILKPHPPEDLIDRLKQCLGDRRA